jgi:hypothetical protein
MTRIVPAEISPAWLGELMPEKSKARAVATDANPTAVDPKNSRLVFHGHRILLVSLRKNWVEGRFRRAWGERVEVAFVLTSTV